MVAGTVYRESFSCSGGQQSLVGTDDHWQQPDCIRSHLCRSKLQSIKSSEGVLAHKLLSLNEDFLSDSDHPVLLANMKEEV